MTILGHSLGYFHEHARFDREDYVDIITENIPAAYLSQFSKTSPISMITFGVEYDLGSVMHYDPYVRYFLQDPKKFAKILGEPEESVSKMG